MGQPNCVEGVVAVIERDGCLLAIRRADGIAAGGYWCLPGGAIEPGESPADAVVREVQEEIGLCVRPIAEMWQWRRSDDQLLLYWWRVHLEDETQRLSLATAEVAEARWVPPEEFRTLHPVIESSRLFVERFLCMDG